MFYAVEISMFKIFKLLKLLYYIITNWLKSSSYNSHELLCGSCTYSLINMDSVNGCIKVIADISSVVISLMMDSPDAVVLLFGYEMSLSVCRVV
jgi:hypothetical protein